MSGRAAHDAIWQTSELIFCSAFLGGIALEIVWPLSLKLLVPSVFIYVTGGILLVLGLTIIICTQIQLSKAGQPTAPKQETTELITDGILACSRNPLYLGGVIAFTGFGIGADLPWLLVLLLPVIMIVYRYLILPEEQYLERKFGEKYRKYVKTTRRWV